MYSAVVRKQLRLLGIAPHMAGFKYLEQAIALWYPGCAITKEIYPVIAKNNRTDFRAVERSIRYAIKYAWDHSRGNTGVIFEVFGVWAIAQRPTSAEFVSAVALWAEGGTEYED